MPLPGHARLRRSLGRGLLLAGLLLASCTTLPPAGPPLASPGQPLHVTGRFSISETRTLPETHSLHNSGRFQLDRDGQHLQISLYTPFGQTIARAGQQDGQPAWLETAQHQHFSGSSLEDVLEQAIGIPVPVSRLPHWLSDRFQQMIERSADGRHIRAREDRWHIERNNNHWYLAWQQPGQRLDIRLVLDPARPAQPTDTHAPGPDNPDTAQQRRNAPDRPRPPHCPRHPSRLPRRPCIPGARTGLHPQPLR